MSRRLVFALAVLWLTMLLGVDITVMLRSGALRVQLERVLAATFRSPVRFDELSVTLGREIVVRNVRVMRPDDPTRLYGAIASIRFSLDWLALAHGTLRLDEIRVEHPVVAVRWNPVDGTFDMPSPIKETVDAGDSRLPKLPVVRLDGLTLVLENSPYLMRDRYELVLSGLAVMLVPAGAERWLYSFNVELKSSLIGDLHADGRMSATEMVMSLRHGGLTISHALVDALKPGVAEAFRQVSVEGSLDFGADLRPENGPGTPMAFAVWLTCDDVTVGCKPYPQTIRGLKGRIDYAKGRFTTTGLRSVFENAQLAVAGSVDITTPDLVVDLHGDLTGLELSSAFGQRIGKLPPPCPTVGEQIESWDPGGFANIAFRLERKYGPDHKITDLRPFIDLQFTGGASVRYRGNLDEKKERHGFPYPLQELRGTLHFDDLGMQFDRVTATNGTVSVAARGKIGYEKQGDETYDIDILAQGLRLDDRVAAALDTAGAELFNSLDAEGTVDVTIGVKRAAHEPPAIRTEIAVDLNGVRLEPTEFPLPVGDVHGRAIIKPDVVVLENITGRHRGGYVTLAGWLGIDRRAGELDFHITGRDFPVEGPFVAALRPAAADVADELDRLVPAGRIDGRIDLRRLARKPMDARGTVQLKKMSLAPSDPGIRVTDIEGIMEFQGTKVTVKPGTTGRWGGESFAAEGTITEAAGLDLTFESARCHVDNAFLADVEAFIPGFRAASGNPDVDGLFGVKVRLKGKPEHWLVDTDVRADGVEISWPARSGARLTNVHGRCVVAPDGRVTLTGFDARLLPPPDALPREAASGAITAAALDAAPAPSMHIGSFVYTPPPAVAPRRPVPRIVVGDVHLNDLVIEPWLFDALALSPEARATLEGFAISGAVDASVGGLTYDGAAWVIARAHVVGRDFGIGEGGRVQAQKLEILNASAGIAPDNVSFGGDVRLTTARLFDIAVPRLAARLTGDRAGFQLDRVDCDLLGYDAQTNEPLGRCDKETTMFAMNFGDSGFVTKVRVLDVNMAGTVRSFGGDPGHVTGLLKGVVDLTGTLSDSATWKGTGSITASARRVVDLPFFYRFFRSLDLLNLLQSTGRDAQIAVEAQIANRVVELPVVSMSIPGDVSFTGSGSLSFGGIIHVDLEAHYPVTINPLSWVFSLVSGAAFPGATIDGPLEDPVVTPRSAPSDGTGSSAGRRPITKPLKKDG